MNHDRCTVAKRENRRTKSLLTFGNKTYELSAYFLSGANTIQASDVTGIKFNLRFQTADYGQIYIHVCQFWRQVQLTYLAILPVGILELRMTF